MKDHPRVWAVLLAAIISLVSACSTDLEPTEQEMRHAVEQALSGQGNASGAANELRIDNPLNGITVGIIDFEKLSCVPANGKPGFTCDYRIATRMHVHSNEGSAAGQGHAAAVNQLMSWLSGGRTEGSTSTVTARFVKAKGKWVRLDS